MTTKKATKKKSSKKSAAKRTGSGSTRKKAALKKTPATRKKATTRTALKQPASQQHAATDPKPAVSAPAPKRQATGPKRTSLLDAAAQVLAGAEEPMSCRQIVDEVLKRKLWTTKGKTPHQTLHAAMIRDIQKQGKKSRFKKTGRGRFAENDGRE